MSPGRTGPNRTGYYANMLVPGAAMLLAAGLAIYFHNRFWWPPDEGVYAYVASRLLHGDTLNGTIQDLHAGYINLWHALMMHLFGEDLASLRYPLAALTVAAALIAYRLLSPAGRGLAAAGGVAMATHFFLPFLNPTANWYALFIALVIIAVLAGWPDDRRGKWEIVGFLIATLFLFRQLSGVIVAMGVVAHLVATVEGRGPRRLARGLLGLLGLGLALYLWQKGSLIGFALIGVWPLLLLLQIARTTGAGDRATVRAMGRLIAGGIAGLMPIIVFHLVQGTLATWIDDTVVSAFALTGLDFIGRASYGTVGILAFGELVGGDAAARLNGSYWLFLLAVPPLAGIAALWRWRDDAVAQHPLPVMAAFFSVTALHFQIPIYLTYTSGLSLVALLWLAAPARRFGRRVAVTAVLAAATVAVGWQAAQPVSGTLADIVAGKTRPLTDPGLPRASLWMEPEEADTYRRLLLAIDRSAAEDAPILTLPMNPEIYFLSKRHAPVRFYATALGLRDGDDVANALSEMAALPPAMIVHRPDDKYNTVLSDALLDALKTRYAFWQSIGGFDLYIPQSR